MTKMYDQQFLKDTIYLLKDQIADLSKWSVYNEDKYSDAITIIESELKEIERTSK
jgi:hypothetical protein